MFDLVIYNNRNVLLNRGEYLPVKSLKKGDLLELISRYQAEDIPLYMGFVISLEQSIIQGNTLNKTKVYLEKPFYIISFLKACFEIGNKEENKSVSFLFGDYPPSNMIKDEHTIIFQLPNIESDNVNDKILFEENYTIFIPKIKDSANYWKQLLSDTYDAAEKTAKRYMRETLLMNDWNYYD
ncbi:MAG: hypothetical protein ACK5Z2_05655 [Bacteroidota bacterium]|jgi:hypothetical protein